MCIENNLSKKKMLGLFNSTGQILKYYLQKLFTADKRIKKENSAASFFVFELEPPSRVIFMKKISVSLVIFLLLMTCPSLSMPVFSETSADTGVKLDVFLEQWNQQLSENEEYGPFIHTGIFMTMDEWHDGLISESGNIFVDLFLDINGKDAAIIAGQMIVHRSLMKSYFKLRSHLQSALQNAKTISGFDDIMGYYDSSHADEYHSLHFVMSGSEIINGYGENRHLISYVYETENKKNSLHGYSVKEFVSLFLPHIDESHIDGYIKHPGIDEVRKMFGESVSDEQMAIFQRMIEAESTLYVFPYSETINIELYCNPATSQIRTYSLHSSVRGGQELFRKFLEIYFEISDCSLPVQTIDLLQLMNGEEFTWRDVESIQNYPMGHMWETMYLADEDWCLYVEDDEHGIPSVTFYMYDERYERQNGWMW